MRRAIYYSLCCYSCGCCKRFYVLPLLLLLLCVVMDFWKSVSRRRQIITAKISGSSGRVLASGPVKQGFECTRGRVLVFFSLLIFAHTKTHTFFSFQWYVDVCLYALNSSGNNVPFYSSPHVLLYSSTINNVLFTAVGRQMSGFEPSLLCFFVFFPANFFRSFLSGWVG